MITTEPIVQSLIAEVHSSQYLMHKYWARKPHNVVRAYIQHFSEPGDVVLDPFAGSGVTLMESLVSGRRAIAVDINPIATLITRATVTPIDLAKANVIFAEIMQAVKPEADRVFSTFCAVCGQRVVISHIVWSSVAPCPNCGEKILLGKNGKVHGKYRCSCCSNLVSVPARTVSGEYAQEIWFTCAKCTGGRIQSKVPDARDLDELANIEARLSSSLIKNDQMVINKRTLIYEGMGLHSFFTNRNRYLLSLIVDTIDRVEDVGLRELFTFTFTSCLAQASRLIPYRNALTTGGPAWTVSGFWIPPLHLEMNGWRCFENRFRKVINGKKKIAAEKWVMPYRCAQTFDDLNLDGTALISTRSATDLHDFLPSDSVDYIFADPPYGDSVPYLEYSAFWLGWFGITPDYENEIIISNSSLRDKGIVNYRTSLRKVFDECYRVLKPGRWMTLTFHNRYLNVWDALVSGMLTAGFEFVNCTYQVPAVIPAKAQLSRSGSVTGDVILNFRKPVQPLPTIVSESVAHFKDVILGEAERTISERGGEASTDEIIRAVIITLLKARLTHVSEYAIISILKERFESKDSHWSLRPQERHLIKRYEQLNVAIERIVYTSLRKGIKEPRELLAAVLSELANGRTPDLSTVLAIIDHQKQVDQADSSYQQATFILS